MASGETVYLFDKNDVLVDAMVLPNGYMEGVEPRWIVVEGKKYVEGGRPNSFYAKQQFGEVEEIVSEHAG